NVIAKLHVNAGLMLFSFSPYRLTRGISSQFFSSLSILLKEIFYNREWIVLSFQEMHSLRNFRAII
ncbi:MAG TPA: hypothetical protein VNR61_12385, partial [Niallia sp.]|nr:hypothetical protein [Niallia sp.]